MSEERINIHASEKKFRVGIFSPTEWAAGMSTPSMTVELYPVFHESSVSFEANLVTPLPDVSEGIDPETLARKVTGGIVAELEAEGGLPPETRKGDLTWILHPTGGYISPGHDYAAVIWFVSERPGDISAVWISSTDALDRKDVSVQEPRGHRYKV